MSQLPPNRLTSRLLSTAAVVALGTLLFATFFQTCLSSRHFAENLVSPPTYAAILKLVGISAPLPGTRDTFAIPFGFVLVPCMIFSLVTWLGGAAWLRNQRRIEWSEALILWGWYGWIAICLTDTWEWLWIAMGATGWLSAAALLSAIPQLWLAGCLAGWFTSLLTLASPVDAASIDQKPIQTRWLWLACGAYIFVFTTMNWRLYANLLVPHGDSAMYEEHLWNLLHGKGFRSYLDRGLFFGEHIQFVHLFLIPLYLIWTSLLLLEACSSTALALGAFPVYWMAKRHTGSERTALAIAIAYLLYFPMQFLDIEIDLKTFRPESFGIPLLLLTLDQLDRRNVAGTILGIAACLTVKEDYTLIFGPLGLWIAFFDRCTAEPGPRKVRPSESCRNLNVHRIWAGLGLSLFSVGYLWLVTRRIMPWFRSGVEVHYASYFAKFGKSPEEIVHTMISRPGMVFELLVNPETALYALALLAPLAFVPLLAPLRLAVGLPLFGILCLNELEQSKTPQHQFHAPLVAILFWALAAALPHAEALFNRLAQGFQSSLKERFDCGRVLTRHLVWTSALTTGFFFSLSPLGVPFWDPGSSWNWKKLYAPSKRAEMFAHIENSIPTSARVASTDFVHPRFTHYERSYDYSDYQRQVSGAGKRIPDDTDYLVIDTDHRYSKIKHPDEIPEFREHPEQWELLSDQTEGLFIVLKRKSLVPNSE